MSDHRARRRYTEPLIRHRAYQWWPVVHLARWGRARQPLCGRDALPHLVVLDATVVTCSDCLTSDTIEGVA